MTRIVTSDDTPAAAPASLWRNGNFRKFWVGEAFSLYGTQISMFAIPVTAVLLGAGPAQMGLLRSAELFPYLAFALIFGVWIDRVRLRPIMIGANLIRMLLIGAVPILAWAGLLNLQILLVVAFLVGTASVLFDVAWMSYVPILVPDRSRLVEANTKLGVTAASAEAAGPGLAGLMVQVMRAPFALAVDAATYLVSLISLLLLRIPEPPRTPDAGNRRLRAELAEGLRFVFGNRYLRGLALIGFGCNFVITGHSSMFLLYAIRSGLEAGTVGLILSIGAVGGVAGAALSRRVLTRFTPGGLYRFAFCSVFIAPLLIPAASGSEVVLFAMFVSAYIITFMSMGLANVLVMSVRQAITPNALMGRMNAAMRTLLFGGGALGGVVAGQLAQVWGLRTGLWILAAGSALVVVPVLLSPVGRLQSMLEPVTETADGGA
ncbi:MAG: MFS transporter [Jatrophihabitantaceae bacterium]